MPPLGLCVLLGLALLNGCFRHAPPPLPPVATGPPPQPTSITQIPAMPAGMPEPENPEVVLAPPVVVTAPPPKVKVPRAIRRRHPVDATPATTTAAATTPGPSAAGEAQAVAGAAAASAPTPKPAELGQLSAGNGADSKERAGMIEQIHALEVRLSAIKPSAASEDEATQIRLFLAKARQATLSDDLDGARTLALKAKVLLDELSNL